MVNTKDSSLTSADLCRANGWGPGTWLENENGSRIEIIRVDDRVYAGSGGFYFYVRLQKHQWTKV